MLKKHYTDHRHIQPGDEFRRFGETNNTQVFATPNRRSYPFQQTDYPSSHNRNELPDDRIPISSAKIPQTPSPQTVQSAQRTPSLATRTANIGVRRNVLLESPARIGHSTRMRQIFKVADLKHAPFRNHGDVPYPRLPNISRVCSPTTPPERLQHLDYRDININGPGSPLPATQPNSAASEPKAKRRDAYWSPTRSSTSTGSWSGDSGYLIGESSPRARNLTVNPNFHIDDWLSTISLEDSFSQGGGVVLPSCPSSPVAAPGTSTNSLSENCSNFDQATNEVIPRIDGTRLACLTPMTSDRPHYNAMITSQEDQCIDDRISDELSPLSPNVCIGRGPSRHYSLRKKRIAKASPETPTKITEIPPPEYADILESIIEPCDTIISVHDGSQKSERSW